MTATTIVLADDHKVVREGLRALLERDEDICIVGEASDGLEAMHLIEQSDPDVLIVDVGMPVMNGIEVTRLVAQRYSRTRVIILSMHANEAYVMRALRDGAMAYVLKESSGTDLATAVREVVAGRHYLSPPLFENAVAAYIQKVDSQLLDLYETLTNRERQVLQMAAEGTSSAEVGKLLGISPRTVESHRGNFMRKLSLRNQTDLVVFAIERGLMVKEE